MKMLKKAIKEHCDSAWQCNTLFGHIIKRNTKLRKNYAATALTSKNKKNQSLQVRDGPIKQQGPNRPKKETKNSLAK